MVCRNMPLFCSSCKQISTCPSPADPSYRENGGSSLRRMSAYASSVGRQPGCVSIVAHDIKTLCEKGLLHEALHALHVMDEQDTRVPIEAYGYLFKGCIRLKALAEAKQVHDLITKKGVDSNSHLGNSAVDMFVKCGDLSAAVSLFKRLPKKTVLSWTAIIWGCTMAGQCQEALDLYQEMHEQGVKPNKYTYISVLKACASLANLDEGKRIHAEAAQKGFAGDVLVAKAIVDMYVKCGNTENAQKVFDKMVERNAWLWNVMIGGYAHLKQGATALQLYARMREEEHLAPDNWTFVAILKAQGSIAGMEEAAVLNGQVHIKLDSLQKAKVVHAEMERAEHQPDSFVSTTLLDLYTKCGSMLDAQNVFDSLPERDVVPWNAVISGYAEQEEGRKALHLYAQMQEEGVMPNNWIYVSVLKACSRLALNENGILMGEQVVKLETLHKGRQIHEAIRRSGYETDVFVATSLVDMYLKCGSMVDAWCVFSTSCPRSVGVWNAMIAGCAKEALGDKALELYAQMLEENIMPENRTFISALQACSILASKEKDTSIDGQMVKLAALTTAKLLHAELVRRGMVADVFLATTLVDTYVKCGSLVDAHYVFDNSDRRDPVLCNAMIAAYADSKHGEKALELFAEIREGGVIPTTSIFISALKACCSVQAFSNSMRGQTAKLKPLQEVEKLHAQVCKWGYESDPSVGATLVDVYAKCGSLLAARNVFDMLSQRNVVAWNAIITGYAEAGQAEEALQLYASMKAEGMTPNSWIYVSALKACISLSAMGKECLIDGRPATLVALEKGEMIHAETVKYGYDSDLFVTTCLVSMYAKGGNIMKAQRLFDTLSDRDVVSWNTMISGYAELEEHDKAVQLYCDMREAGMTPDDVTFIFLLKACSCSGALNICAQLHSDLVSCGVQLSDNLANTLIHAYGRCGSMENARKVFDALPHPDVVSWNSLMAGYSRQGKGDMTLQCYEEMQKSDTKPDAVTFLCLLTSCSHSGMLDTGIRYFESMGRDYGIPATMEHYSTMVDLLGRAGLLQQAEGVILKMPVQPDLPIWGTLLGACRNFGNLELGKRAFDQCVSIDPTGSSAYMLMSNIYARAGMPEEARRIDQLRGSAGAWKQPGESWIEYGDKMDMFVVGDTSHQETAEILATVEELTSQLQPR